MRYCFSLHEDCRYKNSDHNNKSIKNISCMVTISCKSIYVSEIFGGLLTTDSIFTVSYSTENHTSKIFLKLIERFESTSFIFGRFILSSSVYLNNSKYIESGPVPI